MGNMFRTIVRNSIGEKNFLFAGENPEDFISEIYSLSYFRIGAGHIPEKRYASPFCPMMIAVTGFNDREMINSALMYRYILSYEPFQFKGNIEDFPLTIAYGKLVDALRKHYQNYLWEAEFRDTLEAKVTVSGKPYQAYSVFRRQDGYRAVVVANMDSTDPITATIAFDYPVGHALACASPEQSDANPCGDTVSIPPRSVIAVMER